MQKGFFFSLSSILLEALSVIEIFVCDALLFGSLLKIFDCKKDSIGDPNKKVSALKNKAPKSRRMEYSPPTSPSKSRLL